ncbi:MAG: cupin domain-containing protein [Pseudomonadota bacterium]
MDLRSDFSKREVVHAPQVEWLASPMPGVDRRMLDRIGGEVARATTIVRYAPNSHFSAHTHTGGEEYIVLEGVFQDEHGDFPVGSYVRNPPTSSHTPGSEKGCTIFVKLWQFDMDDRHQMVINMNEATPQPEVARPGVSRLALFADSREMVAMEEWQAGTDITIELPGGGEFLVLDGGFSEGGDVLEKHSWLRLPQGSTLSAKSGENGAKVWMKTGHLPFAKAPAQ